jgi:cystathionine beta-lyase/cystathionine gamma-synthase
LKTLPLRMAQHSANALEVARYLEGHADVVSVRHPWLASFPQGELARRQQANGGGIVAFELRGGSEVSKRFLAELSLCSLAENLGAVETLVTHPASMTHGEVPAAERDALGIGDGLVRLSVGLEEPADIIADIERALGVTLSVIGG